MKLLSNMDGTSRIVENTDKLFVSSDEKTAITHSNRAALDKLGESGGQLTYNGSAIGGSVENLTSTELTLGNYKIRFNAGSNKLEFVYSV